jgi:predicted dehydrogenase
MEKKLKYGIVGCGGIAEGKHLPALENIGDIEVAAYCDIIKERAEACNQKYSDGKAKVFSDYHDLIQEDLDAVLVLTPNRSHSEITVAALEAGKNVLCEKPMAINYKEAQAMIAARDRNKKLLTIGYQYRFRPDCLYLKAECKDGALGEIYYARATWLRRRGVPTWGVFLDEAEQGGGPLIDIGTHALDLTLFMMDNYSPAYAVGSVYHKLNKDRDTANSGGDWDPEKFTVEDSAFGFVVMKNGATINVEASWALNLITESFPKLTLCGTKAGADNLKEGALRINGVKHNKMYTTIPELGANNIAYYEGKKGRPEDIEALTFRNALRGKGGLYVKAEEAAAVTRILEGIYTSAKTGKPYYFD